MDYLLRNKGEFLVYVLLCCVALLVTYVIMLLDYAMGA